MVKKTVEISQQPCHVAVRDRQLVLLPRAPDQAPLASIPCEDLGLLLVDQPAVTYTHAALATLLEHGAAVVLCGRNHLPAGLLVPLADHTEVVWRIRDQFALRPPHRKQLWTRIVRAKIRAQAANLSTDSPGRRRLLALARAVRSGDPENVEAQAARAYWPALFDPAFRRDPDADGVNSLLNYGYAVLRAAVARAIVGAGLFPALGIHHANRSNAFCLADDLVEPLRPLVDRVVADLAHTGRVTLTPETKRPLLELLGADVRTRAGAGPLMVAVHRYVASFVACLTAGPRLLDVPVVVSDSVAAPDADS